MYKRPKKTRIISAIIAIVLVAAMVITTIAVIL